MFKVYNINTKILANQLKYIFTNYILKFKKGI